MYITNALFNQWQSISVKEVNYQWDSDEVNKQAIISRTWNDADWIDVFIFSRVVKVCS